MNQSSSSSQLPLFTSCGDGKGVMRGRTCTNILPFLVSKSFFFCPSSPSSVHSSFSVAFVFDDESIFFIFTFIASFFLGSRRLEGSVRGKNFTNILPFLVIDAKTSESTEEPSYSGNWEPIDDASYQHPRTVAIFETPSNRENYLDSEESAHGTVYLSMQDEDVFIFSPGNEFAPPKNGANLYEQRSSLPAEGDMTGRQLSGPLNFSDFKMSRGTKLEYVKDKLCSAELMTEDFLLGQINEIIMPNVFDGLEKHIGAANDYQEQDYKLERKVWFDCISACLELRCRQAFVGSCKGCLRWMELNHRKGRLAEEVYNEIINCKSMEEEMVDELVDKDMSTGYGNWLDFDMEASEKVSEIEWEISTGLVAEIVSNLLLV